MRQPNGRKARFRLNSVRNPWSKNVPLIQCNPMKKIDKEAYCESSVT